MPDENPKQEESARPAKSVRAEGDGPAGTTEDVVDVLYHGPSDTFVTEHGRMERGGTPVKLPRASLDRLRGAFPDHAWSEVASG